MTKTIAFITALLFSTIFNHSSGMSHRDTITTAEPAGIATLIINANVNIVLVNKEKASPDVEVDPSLKKLVTLKQTGDTLVINCVRDKHNTKEGTIYIPANGLRKIQINSEARVRSFSRLQIPKLDVIINGACDFTISNIGEVNLIGTDNYEIEQTTEVRHWPAGILTNR